MNKKSQRGISFLGVMLLAPPVVLFLLTAIKLAPVYIQDASVKSALKAMAGERAETYTSPAQVRDALLKRLEINDVRQVGINDVAVELDGPFYDISVDYEVHVPLFYNLTIVATFSDKGEVPSS